MARSNKFTFEEKLNADCETVNTWIINYKYFGINGLINTHRNNLYTAELKISAV